jgi:hypothetical protein
MKVRLPRPSFHHKLPLLPILQDIAAHTRVSLMAREQAFRNFVKSMKATPKPMEELRVLFFHWHAQLIPYMVSSDLSHRKSVTRWVCTLQVILIHIFQTKGRLKTDEYMCNT